MRLRFEFFEFAGVLYGARRDVLTGRVVAIHALRYWGHDG